MLCLDMLKKDKSIIQDLYGQNYYKQKNQNQGEFVTNVQSLYGLNFESCHQDLLEVNENLKTQPKKTYMETMKKKTIFMRTSNRFDKLSDFKLLYFLSCFGLKYILKDETAYCNLMHARLQQSKEEQAEFEEKYRLSMAEENAFKLPGDAMSESSYTSMESMESEGEEEIKMEDIAEANEEECVVSKGTGRVESSLSMSRSRREISEHRQGNSR